MERRTFLSSIGAAAAMPWLGSLNRIADALRPAGLPSEDDLFIDKQLRRGVNEGLAALPMPDLVAAIGRTMIGMPYAANTLEQPGEEHLVINFRAFDCVTFFESTLALARTIKLRGSSTTDYARQLQFLRYRSGAIAGYQSRLHYFADWVIDNQTKLTVRDVTRQLGGRRDRRTINFMSEHRSAYLHLADDAVLAAVKDAEGRISAAERYFIPKEMVREVQGSMRNGDIVGITTSISGLDCSHTGLAVEEAGSIRFLHASLDAKRVMISAATLADYLAEHAKQTGILVVRPTDPSAR